MCVFLFTGSYHLWKNSRMVGGRYSGGGIYLPLIGQVLCRERAKVKQPYQCTCFSVLVQEAFTCDYFAAESQKICTNQHI